MDGDFYTETYTYREGRILIDLMLFIEIQY